MPGRTFPTARPAGRTRARSRSGASTTAPPTPSRCGRGTGRDHEADVAIAMSERRSDHVTAKQSPRRQHKDGRVAPPDGSVELASVDGRVHLLGRPTDRSGPQCGEESRASVSAAVRREFPAIIITERSTRPSADRKRSRSNSRVVQRVTGASGGQDLLSRCCPAECWAIRILSRICRNMTIPNRRTAEDGAGMRTPTPTSPWRRPGCAGRCPTPDPSHQPWCVESLRPAANASCHDQRRPAVEPLAPGATARANQTLRATTTQRRHAEPRLPRHAG